jgi:hypothetical protein
MHPMYSPSDATSFFTRFATETEDISMQLFNTVSGGYLRHATTKTYTFIDFPHW